MKIAPLCLLKVNKIREYKMNQKGLFAFVFLAFIIAAGFIGYGIWRYPKNPNSPTENKSMDGANTNAGDNAVTAA